MRSRWVELGRVDKGVTLLGLTEGGAGILAWVIFVAEGFLSSHGGSNSVIVAVESFAVFSAVILIPLLSALGLVFLPLKAERRGILSFISLLGSMLAMIPALFFLSAFYCMITHSTCS